MAKLKKGRLVRVTWVDSATPENRWTYREDFKLDTYRMISVGYVWARDAESVALAPHVDEELDQACGIMIIPRCSIVKVERL